MKNLTKQDAVKSVVKDIERDFGFLRDKKGIEAVLLYGSWAKNEQNVRSDIDVCIVAPDLKTPKQFAKLLGVIWRKINANKYDVRIFEELPLYIKMDIIKNHRIIFSKNTPELYYYFYHYRKLWNDQSLNWLEART